MKTIHELESEIRDFINSPRKQASLLRNHATWGMLCSSLDVVGDTELALTAYLANGEARPEHEDHLVESGNLYLTLYGVLQVLFVQRDAIENLAKSLGCTLTSNAAVKAIREDRNDATGHPTDRRGGKHFCFVSRPTLSRWGCELLTMRADGTSDFRTLDIRKMVEVQREAVKTWLGEIIAHLRAEEMAHREKFRGEKLAAAFPETLGYYHEKIGETIRGGGRLPRSFGADLLVTIQGYIDKFKSQLADREAADAYDAVNYALEELEYPIAQVLTFLRSSPESTLNERDAAIYHFFIRRKLEELIQMAREIDADYEGEV